MPKKQSLIIFQSVLIETLLEFGGMALKGSSSKFSLKYCGQEEFSGDDQINDFPFWNEKATSSTEQSTLTVKSMIFR